MLSLWLCASPALRLAPLASAPAAHRLAQPLMQFGAMGGQTPFAPLGTAGGGSSANSGEMTRHEVTGEVLKKKKKKRKTDPNTGMLEQGAHRPDNSGVAHVPVPSPYHVFEPSMVTSRGYSDSTRPAPGKATPRTTAPRAVPRAARAAVSPTAPIALPEVTRLRQAADEAEAALAQLVQQRQVEEAAFKEEMAQENLTGDRYDAMLAGHLQQRQGHAARLGAATAACEDARRKAALAEQLFTAEQAAGHARNLPVATAAVHTCNLPATCLQPRQCTPVHVAMHAWHCSKA